MTISTVLMKYLQKGMMSRTYLKLLREGMVCGNKCMEYSGGVNAVVHSHTSGISQSRETSPEKPDKSMLLMRRFISHRPP